MRFNHTEDKVKDLPSRSSLSSLLASRLSFRSCRSISWLILFCSLASSDMQHSMIPQSGGPQSVLTRGALSFRQAFQPRHTTPKNYIDNYTFIPLYVTKSTFITLNHVPQRRRANNHPN